MEIPKEELVKRVKQLYNEKKYQEIIDLLPVALLETLRDTRLYVKKGEALSNLGNSDFKKTFQDAIELEHKNPHLYYSFGFCLHISGNHNDAIEQYQTAIKFRPKHSNYYCFLAYSFDSIGDYKQAIKETKKAIKLDPENCSFQIALGSFYHSNKEHKRAIPYLLKAISIEPENEHPYYYLGNVYYELKQYTTAKENYEKYLQYTKDEKDSYYYKYAKGRIKELKKLIADAEYSAISDIVSNIKELLLYKGSCVTHYTSLTAAKAMILEGSLFRLSEGAFLNDTSEGRVLFKYLPSKASSLQINNDTIDSLFAKKPFIGSFVIDNKHNDLTLWRMYGKEEKEEARGCAVTIRREDFLSALENIPLSESEQAVTSEDKINTSSKAGEIFNFYKVAYRDETSNNFIIPGSGVEEVDLLNGQMVNLHDKVREYFSQDRTEADEQKVTSLLNDIAYLFKGAEYHYEQEIRLVIEGDGFTKIIDGIFSPKNEKASLNKSTVLPKDTKVPPKVYINLVSIRPLVQRITLGPKVNRADEWASAFYYSLDEEGYNPEISISHLPFK